MNEERKRTSKCKHNTKKENINYRKNVLFNNYFLDNEIMLKYYIERMNIFT